MTEWGSLSLVDGGEADVDGQSVSLPGTRKGDMSSRHWKPEVNVSSIMFSPTGMNTSSLVGPGKLHFSVLGFQPSHFRL